MKFETVNQALEALKHMQDVQSAYHHALGMIHHDASTAAPEGSWEGRGKTMAIMSKIVYDLNTNPENDELLSYLEAHIEELEPQQRREVAVLRKGFDRTCKVPADESIAYSVLRNEAQSAWVKAKNTNDFALFAPYLEKIFAYEKKFAGYYNPEMDAYDSLLNEYEEGLNSATLDAFFGQLRETIVPLIAKVQAAEQIDDSFLHAHYPADIQRKFSDYLMDVMGLDRNYCAIAETEHPYTMHFNTKDVRITTHYYEDNLASSLFSVVHEGGHGLYELGGDDKYNHTCLNGGASMSLHESQSRFYENLIGRSEAFTKAIFPKVKELFPQQMEGVDAAMFYRAVNKSEPSLIRTEADELTYALHIMIRYEIEKMVIGGSLEVKDIPAMWNKLYKDYLGIDVPNDAKGCLQDMHWGGGMIGYFPSYALGSAYAVQMLRKMEEEIGDVYGDVANGDLSRVTGWLKEKIHRHGSFYKPGELFESVCGKFDAKYFTDYLTEKFSKLYNL